MKKQDFLNDVMHEINALRKLATPKELAKLDFDKFNPEFPTKCIYGQMTGACTSSRAKELMDEACIKVFDLPTGCNDIYGKTFNDNKKYINGKNNGQGWGSNTWTDFDGMTHISRNYTHLSALEGVY